MPRYRKKPVEIEAFKYGKDGQPDWFVDKVITNEIITFTGEERNDPFDFSTNIWCEIKTPEETMRGDYGDYIIQGIKGEIYPCKADIFEATYESAQIDELSWRDVFDSQRYFPSDWHECLYKARELMYSNIAFNGNVYDTRDTLMSNRICTIEDLK